MKAELIKAVSQTEKKIQLNFEKSFKKIYSGNIIPDNLSEYNLNISRKRITCFSDFESVTSGDGFYIILTDCPIDNNNCILKSGKITAVYRGQASTVKKRLSSHLTNKEYNRLFNLRKVKYLSNQIDDGKTFYEKHLSACMKFDPNKNGVNVEDNEYSNFQWIVIVHEMKKSGERVRELAEFAFDNVFGKPIASRE